MNILLINYEYPPLGAGAATATYHIGKELVGMGHRVMVLTSGYREKKGYALQDGMTIFRCPAKRRKISESNIFEMASFVISAFICMPYLLLKHRPEGAVVFFSFPCGPLGLWAKFLFNIPYIISLRGGDVPGTERHLDRVHKILKPLRHLIFKNSKAVVANSEGLKQLAQKTDPVPIRVIPNGIDTSFFKPVPEQIKTKTRSFVFVGRFSEQKNLFFLLEQIKKLRDQADTPFVLNMVGDGPLKKALQKTARDLKISDIIKWHGWLEKDQILKLLQTSDCFFNISLYEGMPNAVLEAMAVGLPVIVSNVAGNDALIKDGVNGICMDLDDVENFQLSAKKIIENSGFRTKLGKKARQEATKKYSWQNCARQYLALFSGSYLERGSNFYPSPMRK